MAAVSASGSGSHSKAPLGKRVLVVDDDEGNATLLTRLLELSGHQVRVASDGPGALARAKEFQPHVVLLDIGLPGMDGFEVARRLRALASPKATLVAVSGYEQDDQPEPGRAVFDHYLVKPASIDVLQRIIEKAE